jgi:hypothetical protein
MTSDEYADAFNLVRTVKDMLQKKFEPQGFNVGVNCGEAAGQTVPDRQSNYTSRSAIHFACLFPMLHTLQSHLATFALQ